MVARYLSGSKPSMQDVLSLQSLWNVLEVYNWALLVEKQKTRPALRSGQWGSRSGQGISNRYKVEQQAIGPKPALTVPKWS